MLLFIVACGKQDGVSTSGDSGDPGLRSAMGGFIQNAIQITNAVNEQANPSTAYDDSSHVFFTVWSDAREMNPLGKDIYGAFINSLNGSVIKEIAISNTAGDQIQPSVAFALKEQRYLVVFTNSVDHLRCRPVRRDGRQFPDIHAGRTDKGVCPRRQRLRTTPRLPLHQYHRSYRRDYRSIL